jgi:hypothetical protein
MRRLQQIFKGETTFDDLLQRHRREAELQDRVQRALPPALAKHVAVIDARSAELELGAASGAAAALLRQRAPELKAALAREGFEFTGIRVRVQARLAREEPPKLPTKQLDSASAATIMTLAAELGESPLAQALRRLAGIRARSGSVGTSVGNLAGTSAGNPIVSGSRDQSLEGIEDQDPEQ